MCGDEGESVKRSTWTGGISVADVTVVTSSERKRRCDCSRRILPRSLVVPHVLPPDDESKAPPPTVDDMVEVGEAASEAGPPSRRSVIGFDCSSSWICSQSNKGEKTKKCTMKKISSSISSSTIFNPI